VVLPSLVEVAVSAPLLNSVNSSRAVVATAQHLLGIFNLNQLFCYQQMD
jgi:hypothetical protein